MDPYRPPKAGIADPPAGAGSAFKAVAYGFLVDVGGSLLFSALVSVLYSMYLASNGVPLGQLEEQLQADLRQGWGFGIATAIGCGFSVLGGYVCARVSRRVDRTLPAVLAALSVGLGLVLGWSTYDVIEMLSLSVLTVAAILVGWRLGVRRTLLRQPMDRGVHGAR